MGDMPMLFKWKVDNNMGKFHHNKLHSKDLIFFKFFRVGEYIHSDPLHDTRITNISVRLGEYDFFETKAKSFDLESMTSIELVRFVNEFTAEAIQHHESLDKRVSKKVRLAELQMEIAGLLGEDK